MNWQIEYLIEEKECVACEHYGMKVHEEPCYKCFETKSKPNFSANDIDSIIANYTTNA